MRTNLAALCFSSPCPTPPPGNFRNWPKADMTVHHSDVRFGAERTWGRDRPTSAFEPERTRIIPHGELSEWSLERYDLRPQR